MNRHVHAGREVEMRINFVVFLLTLFLSFSALAQDSTRASTPMFKGMELYSWRDRASGIWSYSLLAGTNRDKKLTEIKNPDVVVYDVAQLKVRLASLAQGEQVFWFITPSSPDLSYPPEAVVDDLVKFAAEHNVALHIAQGRMAAPQKSRSGRRPGPSAGWGASPSHTADGRPADTPGVARYAHPSYELLFRDVSYHFPIYEIPANQ